MGQTIEVTTPGSRTALQCTCCGHTSTHPEDFGLGSCWACADGNNASCATCLTAGVFIAGWREHDDGAKHLLVTATDTACGLTLAAHQMGPTGDRPACPRCQPATSVAA